jgi:hypothetical protein
VKKDSERLYGGVINAKWYRRPRREHTYFTHTLGNYIRSILFYLDITPEEKRQKDKGNA